MATNLTADASLPARKAKTPTQFARLRKEITRIPGTLEELVSGACGLMKSRHNATIVHGGVVGLPRVSGKQPKNPSAPALEPAKTTRRKAFFHA
jgi:hypothetical protein